MWKLCVLYYFSVSLVCVCVYRALAQLLPEAGIAYESLQENRKQWVDLKSEGKRISEED